MFIASKLINYLNPKKIFLLTYIISKNPCLTLFEMTYPSRTPELSTFQYFQLLFIQFFYN